MFLFQRITVPHHCNMSPRVFALFAVLVVVCSFMNTEVAAMEKELAVVDAKELLEFMGKALEVFFLAFIKLKMNCVLTTQLWKFACILHICDVCKAMIIVGHTISRQQHPSNRIACLKVYKCIFTCISMPTNWYIIAVVK